MRAVIQRVKEAAVRVENEVVGAIDSGLLVLLAVHKNDTKHSCDWMAEKILGMRIFPDERGKFQYDLSEVKGEILVISQFTLYGDCSRGKRPEFLLAAPPDSAFQLYSYFLEKIKNLGFTPKSGRFGAKMELHSINDGPVTIILDR